MSKYLSSIHTLLILSLMLLSGCGLISPKSQIDIYVSSNVLYKDIDAVAVTLSSIQVYEVSAQKWTVIEINETRNTFNLMEIKDSQFSIATDNLRNAKYSQIRLAIDSVSVTFKDGKITTASITNNNITLDIDFEIRNKRGSIPIIPFLVVIFDTGSSVNTLPSGDISFTPILDVKIGDLVVPSK
ncbi:hypothetical protein DGWBC_1156 [Dehalogenimonas sp. WBC-2]|nr:hypothetical protein DGWBC_1156 [Dehalogenimonas sp. WBC-2]